MEPSLKQFVKKAENKLIKIGISRGEKVNIVTYFLSYFIDIEIIGNDLNLVNDELIQLDPVLIIHTKTHIGIWRKRWFCKEKFLVPLSSVANICTNEMFIEFQFINQKKICVKAENKDILQKFISSFVEARAHFFADNTIEYLKQGDDLLSEKNLESALSVFEKASKLEHFHCGIFLIRYLILVHLGKGVEAANELIQASVRASVIQSAEIALLWPEARFNSIQIYQMAEFLSVSSSYKDLYWYQLLFRSIQLAKEDLWEEVTNVLELALAKSPNDDISLKIMLFVCKVLPKSYFLKLIKNEVNTSSNIHKFLKKNTLFIKQNFDVTEQKRLKKSSINLATKALSDFFNVFDWHYDRLDKRKKTREIWKLLRKNKLNEVRKLLEVEPNQFYKVVSEGYPPSDPVVWFSALICAELLLRDGNYGEVKILMKNAYSLVAYNINQTSDIFLQNATSLCSIYCAIADKDIMRCQLYLDIISKINDLVWVHQLVSDLVPSIQDECTINIERSGEILKNFCSWLEYHSTHKALSSHSDWKKALTNLYTAQTCNKISIVVGGETSSGKSSFLNALIGAQILHATQREATAIPTHISYASDWKATAWNEKESIIDSCCVGNKPTKENFLEFSEFIKNYTFLGSNNSKEVKKMVIEAPLSSIGKEVEYIDTPGLNAHSLRTEVAEDIIDRAHACIFVIDARNALKSGEMRKIVWASEAVGKTLFVINKADLILVDNDIDCDDDDVLEDLLERVEKELCKTLNVKYINLFVVSSLSPEKINELGEEILSQINSIQDVQNKLSEILESSRDKLIIYSSAKIAKIAARSALNYAMWEVSSCESELTKLFGQIPDDPETFREYVFPRIVQAWLLHQQNYDQALGKILEKLITKTLESIGRGLSNCENHEQLKSFVKDNVKWKFQEFISDIDNARAREWEKVGRAVLKNTVDFFNALYKDVSFEGRFNSKELLRVATPMPFSNSMHSLIESVDQSLSSSLVGGAAAGVIIGSFIAPGVGTLIGGFIGSLMGSSISEELLNEIFEKIRQSFQVIVESVSDAIIADITGDEKILPPMLQAIYNNVEQERKRFENVVKKEISRVKSALKKSQEDAEASQKVASESLEWFLKFSTLITESKNLQTSYKAHSLFAEGIPIKINTKGLKEREHNIETQHKKKIVENELETNKLEEIKNLNKKQILYTKKVEKEKNTESRKQDIIGRWKQYSYYIRHGRKDFHYMGTYIVSYDENGYSIQIIDQYGNDNVNSKGLSNIEFDGTTWTFDSDWGNHGVGKFILKRENPNVYTGYPYLMGQRLSEKNRWERIEN